MKRIVIMILIACALLASAMIPLARADGTQVTIIYSNTINAQVSPVG
jgi:hypothetical protein